MRLRNILFASALVLGSINVSAQCNLLLLGAGTCGPTGGTSPLFTNLIVDYELDEASGNAIDSVGTLDLTETSGTIAASAGSAGCGPARDFVAADTEYMTHADNAALDTGDIEFAIEAWIIATTLPGSDMEIVSKYEPTGNQRAYKLFWSSGASRFQWRVSNDGSTLTSVSSVSAASTATCYQLFVYHSASGNVIGISQDNGADATAAHTTGVLNGTGPFVVGAAGSATPGAYFNGTIAKVRLWKAYIPDATDRTFLYNSGNGRTYAEIAAH